MKLRTSFFNTTVFKKDLTRFSPAWALYTVGLFMMLAVCTDASETPANLIGISDKKGSLQKGKDADIVIMDRDINVRCVLSKGVIVPGTNTMIH